MIIDELLASSSNFSFRSFFFTQVHMPCEFKELSNQTNFFIYVILDFHDKLSRAMTTF